MTVADEVRSTLDHWSNLEWRPAMWHATAALEMTATRRYPSSDPGTAFRRTLRDDVDVFGPMAAADIDFGSSRFPLPIASDLPDRRPDIADLMYAVYRYLHIDESEMPAGCEVVPHMEGVPLFAIATGRLWLRASAAIGLLAIAVFAPESEDQQIPESYFLSWQDYNFPVGDSWGRREQFREIVANAGIPRHSLDFGPEWEGWGPVL